MNCRLTSPRKASQVVALCLAVAMGVRGERLVGADVATGAQATDTAATDEYPLEADKTRSLASLLPLITEEAVAGVVVYPRQFFESHAVRSLPVEVVAAELEGLLGVNPQRIEFAIAFLERGPAQPFAQGVIIKFADNFDLRRLPSRLLRETVYGTLDSRPYRKGKGALDLSLLLLDSRTLILAPDRTLARMLATREVMPNDESISQQLSHGIGKALDVHLVANTISFRPLVALQLEKLGGQAEAWRSFTELLDEVERLELRARLSQDFAIGAVMDASSNEAAQRIQSWWDEWRDRLADPPAENSQDVSQPASLTLGEEPMVLPDDATRDRVRQFTRYIRRSLQDQLLRQSFRIADNRVQWGMAEMQPSKYRHARQSRCS